MAEFQLTREYLEGRVVASDRAIFTDRIKAYRHLKHSNGQPLIVSEEKGCASSETRVPEVDATDLTVEKLRDAMAGHGGLIIRKMFSGSEIETLKHAIDQVQDVFDLPRKKRTQMATPYFNPPSNMASIMPEKEQELASQRYFNGAGGGAMCAETPCVWKRCCSSTRSTI